MTVMKNPCDGCQGKLYEEDACSLNCKEYKEYHDFWDRYFKIAESREVVR